MAARVSAAARAAEAVCAAANAEAIFFTALGAGAPQVTGASIAPADAVCAIDHPLPDGASPAALPAAVSARPLALPFSACAAALRSEPALLGVLARVGHLLRGGGALLLGREGRAVVGGRRLEVAERGLLVDVGRRVGLGVGDLHV